MRQNLAKYRPWPTLPQLSPTIMTSTKPASDASSETALEPISDSAIEATSEPTPTMSALTKSMLASLINKIKTLKDYSETTSTRLKPRRLTRVKLRTPKKRRPRDNTTKNKAEETIKFLTKIQNACEKYTSSTHTLQDTITMHLGLKLQRTELKKVYDYTQPCLLTPSSDLIPLGLEISNIRVQLTQIIDLADQLKTQQADDLPLSDQTNKQWQSQSTIEISQPKTPLDIAVDDLLPQLNKAIKQLSPLQGLSYGLDRLKYAWSTKEKGKATTEAHNLKKNACTSLTGLQAICQTHQDRSNTSATKYLLGILRNHHSNIAQHYANAFDRRDDNPTFGAATLTLYDAEKALYSTITALAPPQQPTTFLEATTTPRPNPTKPLQSNPPLDIAVDDLLPKLSTAIEQLSPLLIGDSLKEWFRQTRSSTEKGKAITEAHNLKKNACTSLTGLQAICQTHQDRSKTLATNDLLRILRYHHSNIAQHYANAFDRRDDNPTFGAATLTLYDAEKALHSTITALAPPQQPTTFLEATTTPRPNPTKPLLLDKISPAPCLASTHIKPITTCSNPTYSALAVCLFLFHNTPTAKITHHIIYGLLLREQLTPTPHLLFKFYQAISQEDRFARSLVRQYIKPDKKTATIQHPALLFQTTTRTPIEVTHTYDPINPTVTISTQNKDHNNTTMIVPAAHFQDVIMPLCPSIQEQKNTLTNKYLIHLTDLEVEKLIDCIKTDRQGPLIEEI